MNFIRFTKVMLFSLYLLFFFPQTEISREDIFRVTLCNSLL
jgi:hypothetical protein